MEEAELSEKKTTNLSQISHWKTLSHKVVSSTSCNGQESRSQHGLPWPWSYGSWIYNYLWNQCLSPLMLWVWISIRARCTTLCVKVCQWLVTGRWFSPRPPVSSINKTDRHDITEILLKVAITIKQTKCGDLLWFHYNSGLPLTPSNKQTNKLTSSQL